MSYRLRYCLAWLLQAVALSGASAQAQINDREASDIVESVLARSEAVFSGKIQYRLITGFPDDGNPTGNEYSLTFSGPSWKLHWQHDASSLPHRDTKGKLLDSSMLKGNVERIESSHKGKSVEYSVTPQEDGRISRKARLESEKRVDLSFPAPPTFAGSIWFEQTRAFIRLNRNSAKLGRVLEISGVKVTVIDWAVDKDKRPSGFHGTNELTRDGGTLRLYAAPSLGYALPRIEYLGTDGQVAARFEAEEFFPPQNGIRIPKRLSLQYFSSKGPGFFAKYELTKVSDINQPLPDKDFVIDLPMGTGVTDARDPKKVVRFRIQGEEPIPEDLSSVISLPSHSFFGKNWQTALLGGGTVGLLGFGIFFVYKRKVAKRGVGGKCLSQPSA